MLVFILVIFGCIVIDQLTKFLAVKFLAPVTTVPVIPKVFHLTYIQNDGAAFSIFSGQQAFLIIISFIFIAFLIYILYSMPKNIHYLKLNIALSMAIGGALGNFIDRIHLGYVIDFFDFRLIGFAIFNFADIFVVLGCLYIIIAVIRGGAKESTQEE